MTKAIAGLGAFVLLGISALASQVPGTAQDTEPKRQREQAQPQEKTKDPRAQKAPDKERAKTQAPAPGTNPGAPSVEQQREIAKKAAYYTRRSRDQQARIDRLIEIYKRKGDTAKVQKLEGMRAQLAKRTDNAMAGFRKRLGDEKWGQLNSEMKKHHGRDEHQKPKPTRPPEKTGPEKRKS